MRGAGVEGTVLWRMALGLACAALNACAPIGGITWPSRAPVPSGTALIAYERASAACRAVDAATAAVSVSGRLGHDRVRGRLLVGADRAGRLRIEALAPFGEPLFVLVAENGRATLLLARQQQVLRDAPASEVLDALAGLRVDPGEVLALLSGCVAEGEAAGGMSAGAFWLVTLGGSARAVVQDLPDAPRLVSGEIAAAGGALRVGYGEFAADRRPRLVRIHRELAGGVVDLQLRLAQVETGVPLGPEALHVRVPAGAEPISLDDLRRSSPLAAR